MKQHFTATAEPEDLARLDAWALSRKLTRGKAIMALLDLAEGNFDVQAGGSKDTHAQDVRPSGNILNVEPVTSASLNLRSPDSKPVALAVGKAVLEATQKRVGVHPAGLEGDKVVKSFDEEAEANLDQFYGKMDGRQPVSEKSQKPDPPGWDEFDQSGKDSE